MPSWARAFADGDVAALTRLRTALDHYHQAAIAPHHDLIHACIDARLTAARSQTGRAA